MSHSGTALIDPYKVFEKISLTTGKRVADLGCGRTGHFVFPAARVVGDTGVVYAVEIVKDILESIKSRARSGGYDNVQSVWADIELLGKIPIPAETLDDCFLVNVFFLLKDKAVALQEAKRLLKPHGVVVIVDWQRKLGTLGPPIQLLTPPETVVRLATEAGFRFVEQITPGEYHYCLIFEKI